MAAAVEAHANTAGGTETRAGEPSTSQPTAAAEAAAHAAHAAPAAGAVKGATANGTAATAEDQGAKADRSKKREGRKRGAKGAAAQQEVTVSEQQADLVRLVRAERRTDIYEDSATVLLSATAGKASQLQLSKDRLSVTGHKGFRTVRATHGVYQGTWYCEVTVKHLGKTGHARLGWCTKKAELQAPVGFDTHGYAYRDLEGSKVHNGCREAYAAPFKDCDVVGMLIHLPEGGRPIEPQERRVLKYKGSLWYEQEPELKPKPLAGSAIHFFVNGVHQGAAYTGFLEGTYYPAVSLFTLPEQSEGATLQLNFGPEFAFPPPAVEGMPPPAPMSEVAARVAAAAAAATATASGPGVGNNTATATAGGVAPSAGYASLSAPTAAAAQPAGGAPAAGTGSGSVSQEPLLAGPAGVDTLVAAPAAPINGAEGGLSDSAPVAPTPASAAPTPAAGPTEMEVEVPQGNGQAQEQGQGPVPMDT